MSFNCLIVDKLHPCLEEGLRDIGVNVTCNTSMSREGIISALPEFQGLVIRSKTRVDKELIGNSKLKFVARAGAGIDNLDVEYLEKSHIEIINAPEGNRDAVGDHTVGLILGLLNNIVKSNSEIRKGLWNREGNRGHELGSKTIGLIGFGNSGRAVASRLASFGCRIMAYDKYFNGFNVDYVEEVGMEKIFNECDIITLHIPLTNETNGMVNKVFIEYMKKPFYVINTSRGEIINTGDLIAGLKHGAIIGAGLDVLENEGIKGLSGDQKVNFDELNNMDNVILTPHVAGWTVESYERISRILYRKIKQIIEDRS